jgi:anti-sigma B factor antagonist
MAGSAARPAPETIRVSRPFPARYNAAGLGGEAAMTNGLIIEARNEGNCTLVTVAGEIDITTAVGLRNWLSELAASGRPIVADLSHVSFIDSTGLGVLAGAVWRAASHGGSFQVVSDQPNIRRLAHLTGLDSQIPLVRTLEEAYQALAMRTAPA